MAQLTALPSEIGAKHFQVGTFLVRPVRDSRFLKSAEVAEAIGVSKVTLKAWLRDGRIPEPVRDPRNGYRLWTPQDVDTIRRMLKEGDNR